MNVWALLGGLALIGVTYLYVRWLQVPSGSSWPQTVRRGSFLYGLPAFAVAGVLLCFDTVLHSIGVDVSTALVGGAGFIYLLLLLMMFLTMFGVPMPPIFVPKWIREQDRARREFKRAARAVRKQAKQRRRAQRASMRPRDE